MYPVAYINVPGDRIVSDEPFDMVNLFLKGPGYSILKLTLSAKKSPVLIDVSEVNYRRVPGSKYPDYYILTSGLTKDLTSQLKSGCEITSIRPDTLFFTLKEASMESLSSMPDNKTLKELKDSL